MSSDWNEVKALFAAALDQPPERRTQWVTGKASDPGQAAEVLALLSAHAEPGVFDELVERQDTLDRAGVLPAGTRVGAWEIEGELGRGGMGIVYRARRADGEYEQQVALKILAWDPPGAAAPRRFKAERQILAGLSHPSIARLLDGGVGPEGRPYYVMDLVDGVRIDHYCETNGLDDEHRLRLFVEVCDAVEAAHQNLIVHRDLKPSNILVDQSGQPKLLDFGIAKSLRADAVGEASAVTRVGARMLTPEYASPEQLRGGRITPASDVYQLGVLLCKLLGGRHRRQGPEAPAGQIADAISGSTPTSDGLDTGLDGDLEPIVVKALALDPERRYPTAAGLADAVRRHLEGRPVGAIVGRRRWSTRQLIGVATPLLVMGAGIVYWQLGVAPQSASKPPLGVVVSSVLWVDDDPDNNVAQLRRFSDVGVEVVTALSTGEALSRYEPGRFQLVVSDMGRFEGPGGAYDGRAGLRLLERLNVEHSDVRFVICTSRRGVAQFGEEALAAGALATFTNCDDVVALSGYPPVAPR